MKANLGILLWENLCLQSVFSGIFEVWGFHRGTAAESSHLKCDAVLLGKAFPTFRVPSSSCFKQCTSPAWPLNMKALRFFELSGTSRPTTQCYFWEQLKLSGILCGSGVGVGDADVGCGCYRVKFDVLQSHFLGSLDWNVLYTSDKRAKIETDWLTDSKDTCCPRYGEMPLPTHSPWFDHSGNIWWGAQTIQFS
jgi:hypothetical protein